MPITVQRNESHWLIGLEGQITLTSAAELKEMLLDWLATGKDVELDLERAEEIDVAIMQLLWSTARQAAGTGARIAGRASSAVAAAVRDSGFARDLGFLLQVSRG